MQLWAELLTATSRITFRDFSCVLWLQDIKDAFLVVKLVFSGSLSVPRDEQLVVFLSVFSMVPGHYTPSQLGGSD